jgi:outer membrane protein assembly factor BamB
MNVDTAARAAAQAIDRSATRLDPLTGLDDLLQRHRRRPLRRVAAAAAVALLVAAAAIWTGLALRPTPQPTLAPITRFRAGPSPTAVAVTPGAAWVLDAGPSNTIARFDASTGKGTATVTARLPERRVGVIRLATIAEGRLWVVSESATLESADTVITAIDPATGETVSTFEVGGAVVLEAAVHGDVAVGSGAVWVALQYEDEVRRFDPADGTLVDRIELPEPIALAVDGGTLWVGSADGRLRSVDVAAGTVRVRATTEAVTRIRVGQGGMWAMTPDGKVLRLDRHTGRVIAQVPGNFQAADLAVGPEGVWVYDQRQGAVLRIDPGSDRVARTIPVISRPLVELDARVLAVGNGAVWVLDKGAGTVVRVDPTR